MKLLKITAFLVILNSGLVALIRESALISPDISPFTQLFRAADGSPCSGPCLLGVYAGITRYADVQAVYMEHPITRGAAIQSGDDTLQAVKHTGNNIFTATCCGFAGSVREISWFGMAPSSPYRVADVIRMLGRPKCIEDYGGTYRLYYSQAQIAMIVVHADRQRVTLDDPVTFIEVYSQNVVAPCTTYAAEPWRGFRVILHPVYMVAP